MSDAKNKPQIDWHSGFAGGLELSFRRYRADLEIEREHPLSKEPLKIDFMVIKKDKDLLIDNAVGRLFRKYNIIEYKNPGDSLNIDVIWKCIGYAGIYKGLGETVNSIPDDELTITIFRNTKPVKLFEQFQTADRSIESPYPGVYYLKGLSILPLQIVIPTELKETDFRALRIMMPNADEEEIRAFIGEAKSYAEKGDRLDADAVLHVSGASNTELYRRIWEEKAMYDFFRDVFNDEYVAAENRGLEKGRVEGLEEGRTSIIEKMLRKGKTPEEIADLTDVEVADIRKIQESIMQLA